MTEEKSLLDIAKAHMSGDSPASSEEAQSGVPMRPPNMAPDNNLKESNDLNKILEGLLSKVKDKKDWVSVKLPTMGYLNPESDGTVEIRPFTFEDEKILRSVMGINDGVEAIASLLSRCVRGIDYLTLSLIDKAYILFKLREISYGNTYPVEATCRQCGDVNDLTIELDKIPVMYAKKEIEDPRPIKLPDSEVTAYLRFPRTKDEELLADVRSLTENLWRFVAKIEEHEDRSIIQRFISKTTAKDIAVIRQGLFDQDLGLQTSVRYNCRKCGADETVDLPLNENFFSVS